MRGHAGKTGDGFKSGKETGRFPGDMKRKIIHPGKENFTLVELLVVVSIIAILASMLLPALSQARQTAQKASCQSNIKQLGTAFQMYVSDYQNYFVPMYDPYVWTYTMLRCKYTTGRNFICPGFDSRTDVTWKKLNLGEGAYDAGTYFYPSYGYNCHFGQPAFTTYPSDRPAVLQEIKHPSKSFLLTDIAIGPTRPCGYPQLYWKYSTTSGHPDSRHLGTVDVLWVDGHATAVSNSKTYPASGYYTGIFLYGNKTASPWGRY